MALLSDRMNPLSSYLSASWFSDVRFWMTYNGRNQSERKFGKVIF